MSGSEKETRQLLETIEIEDILFEHINVLNKEKHPHVVLLSQTYGEVNLVGNGFPPRTRHEVNSGLSTIGKMGINLEAQVINLPFTVTRKDGRLATTAFTDRKVAVRNIYLVPDNTESRIRNDKQYHLDGINELLSSRSINFPTHETWVEQINRLDVGERVATSILHEHGHILTYKAMDKDDINSPLQLFEWFEAHGYFNNCSLRVAGFANERPDIQLNIALEQLAEDYRLGHYIKTENNVCCLPHPISYMQDICNPQNLLKGVEIMTKILKLNNQDKGRKSKDSCLDRILPFGEAPRDSNKMRRYTHGVTRPLSQDDKKKTREYLSQMKV